MEEAARANSPTRWKCYTPAGWGGVHAATPRPRCLFPRTGWGIPFTLIPLSRVHFVDDSPWVFLYINIIYLKVKTCIPFDTTVVKFWALYEVKNSQVIKICIYRVRRWGGEMTGWNGLCLHLLTTPIIKIHWCHSLSELGWRNQLQKTRFMLNPFLLVDHHHLWIQGNLVGNCNKVEVKGVLST